MKERSSFATFAVLAAGSALAVGMSLGSGCAAKVRAFGSGGVSATGSGGQPASSSSTGNGASSSSGGGGLGGSGGQGTGGVPPGPVACNPLTSAECDTVNGEACDWNGSGFQCYPAPNDVALCKPCGPSANSDFCFPGMTCLGSAVCAAFCCADSDCSTGYQCDNSMFGLAVGLCVAPAPDGGAPVPDCNVQLPVASMGTCYTPP